MKRAPKKIAEADVLVEKMCRKKFVLVQRVDFLKSVVMPFTCPLFSTLTNRELPQQQGIYSKWHDYCL